MFFRKYCFVTIAIFAAFHVSAALSLQDQTKPDIQYIALGDSYTIGTGAAPYDAWPEILTRDLNQAGLSVQLAANPAQAGWTTLQVIEHQLPILESTPVDFATLMIGVNDWVQGVSAEQFKERLGLILDRMLQVLPADKILVVNIPDFSVTPQGIRFAQGRNILAGISQFNVIIKEEASQRNIALVDIVTASQQMKFHAEQISSDGLHPSAAGYAFWEKTIYPQVHQLLLLK